MNFDLEPLRSFLAGDGQVEHFVKQVDEHNILLEACKAYIEDANSQLISLPFTPFRGLKNWREKRKDDRLVVIHNQLQPQIHDAEQSLRGILDAVMNIKSKLKEFAHECHTQLVACIDFSNKSLSTCEPIVEQVRVEVDHIMLETICLKAMLQFNVEVVKQVKYQMRVKAQVPLWAQGRNMMGRNNRNMGRAGRANLQAIRDEVNAEDCSDDADSRVVLTQLVELRYSRERAMALLAAALESKETLSNNLLSCIESKNNIENKIRFDTKGKIIHLDVQLNEQRIASFLSDGDCGLDRVWYGDCCHHVYQNGNEVVRRLEACNDIVLTANNKLQRLVELREHMNTLQVQGLQINSPLSDGASSGPEDKSPGTATPTADTSSGSGKSFSAKVSKIVSPLSLTSNFFSTMMSSSSGKASVPDAEPDTEAEMKSIGIDGNAVA